MEIFHITIYLTVFLAYYFANVSSYNISSFPANETELCPTKETWPPSKEVYNNETKECYTVGTRGPCGTYELWFQKDKSQYGSCSCIASTKLCGGNKMNRPIARSKSDGHCYPLFTEANCGKGNWLTVDENWQGICTSNPCLNMQLPDLNKTFWKDFMHHKKIPGYEKPEEVPLGISFWDLNKPFWFIKDGKCFSTFSQGECKEGEITYFEGTSPKPLCMNKRRSPICVVSLSSSGALNCPSGTVKIGNDCKPDTPINFS